MADFGNILRNARLSRGLTLDQVAAETRIALRFLEAIEKEDFESLPGGVFSRGFVRSFAEQVGLDPEKTVLEFERVSNTYREPSIVEEPVIPFREPRKFNRALVPLAIGGLVILILTYYILNRDGTSGAQTVPKSEVTAPADHDLTPAEPPPAEPVLQPALIPIVSSVETRIPVAQPPPENPTISIQIDVHGMIWLKVVTDGMTVVDGQILAPGTKLRYAAQTSIDLVIGNAAALSLKINDQLVPALGGNGQVRFLNITPETVKDIIG